VVVCSLGGLWAWQNATGSSLWRRLWTGCKALSLCSIRFLFVYDTAMGQLDVGRLGNARIGLLLLTMPHCSIAENLHSFSCCAPHTSTGGIMLRCTMNRAMRHRHQLSRAGDEIESVLAFSKRVAFQLVDAAIYFVGLWSLVKWLLR
jgi:hypothetical protein